MDQEPKKLDSADQKSEKEAQLSVARDEIDQITDRLGQPIEAGIKEVVVMCNVHGLPTKQSCEGHPDGWSYGAPWVEIGPELPDQAKLADESVQANLEKEVLEMRTKIVGLLDEFYQNRPTKYSVMLHPEDRAYALRLQSIGLQSFNSLPDKKRTQLLNEYQQEMESFAAFLRDKFLAE